MGSIQQDVRLVHNIEKPSGFLRRDTRNEVEVDMVDQEKQGLKLDIRHASDLDLQITSLKESEIHPSWIPIATPDTSTKPFRNNMVNFEGITRNA